MDSNHAEAYTNLGVLEMRRGALDTAMGCGCSERANQGALPQCANHYLR